MLAMSSCPPTKLGLWLFLGNIDGCAILVIPIYALCKQLKIKHF
jgi:hypothetical protein